MIFAKPLRPLVVALLLCCSFILCAESITGRVIRVSDGDTITISVGSNRKTHRVRLAGIDTPETKQPYGAEARRQLNVLINSKIVTVEFEERDIYQRIVGKVIYQGRDINLEMLMCGLAWHYKQYSKDPKYAEAEKRARQAKLGLWRDPAPIPPWQFRKNRRKANSKK